MAELKFMQTFIFTKNRVCVLVMNLCTNKKVPRSVWIEKMKICVRFENVPCMLEKKRLVSIHFSHKKSFCDTWYLEGKQNFSARSHISLPYDEFASVRTQKLFEGFLPIPHEKKVFLLPFFSLSPYPNLPVLRTPQLPMDFNQALTILFCSGNTLDSSFVVG